MRRSHNESAFASSELVEPAIGSAAAALYDAYAAISRDPGWLTLAEPARSGRAFRLVYETDEAQVWLVEWAPGAGTGWHQNAETAAFAVVEGVLKERRMDGTSLVEFELADQEVSTAHRGLLHSVENPSDSRALTLQAYALAPDSVMRLPRA